MGRLEGPIARGKPSLTPEEITTPHYPPVERGALLCMGPPPSLTFLRPVKPRFSTKGGGGRRRRRGIDDDDDDDDDGLGVVMVMMMVEVVMVM